MTHTDSAERAIAVIRGNNTSARSASDIDAAAITRSEYRSYLEANF